MPLFKQLANVLRVADASVRAHWADRSVGAARPARQKMDEVASAIGIFKAGPLDGKLRRLGTAKDLVDVPGGKSGHVDEVSAICYEPAGVHVLPEREARGQPVFQGELSDLHALTEYECRLQHEECLGVRLHRGTQRAPDVIWRISQLERLQLETHRGVGDLHLLELVDGKRVGENGEALDRGQHLLEQLEPFGRQLEVPVEEPGDVSPWPSETGNEAQRNRVVVDPRHDDGDLGCRSFRGTSSGLGGRDDHIHLESDQFGGEARKSIVLSLGAPELDGDVLTTDVPSLA